MAWLRSHQELARHPKTKKFARLLGISLPQAVGHLHFLWWWALDFAQDGDLTPFDPEDIAEAAGWDGEAEVLVEALINARGPSGHGFLDNEDGLHIHDWDEYAGRLIEQRKKNAERMKKARAANVPNTCETRTGARVEKSRVEKSRGEEERARAREEAPAPPQSTDDIHYGYRATSGSRKSAEEFIRKVEALFGVYPFNNRQIGDKTADRTKEELAAILRILSTDEALGIVRERYDARLQETKGADRPTNLVWYMPALKEAFFAKDRSLEMAERRRDEEKRAGARASPDEPKSMAGIIEEVAQGADLTEEERERIVQRIRKVKERIATGGP